MKRLLGQVLYGLPLLIGFGLGGWLLSLFQVHWLVWTMTLLLTAYLAWVGIAGIVVANAWGLGLIYAAALTQIWPTSWPWPGAQVWALALLGLWLFSFSLFGALALSSARLKQARVTAQTRIGSLGGITWLALGLSELAYQMGILT
jgi:hypothetical protein